MTIRYTPGNGFLVDDFDVTTDPANTSLSQSGPGSDGRNHATAHEDLGDAIQNLQEYASIRTHDHSSPTGTADTLTGRIKGTKLAQANTHESADTDASATAIHHTLSASLPANGTVDQFKAAAGNHTHEYATLNSTPIRTCVSTNRPSNAPVGTLIVETDATSNNLPVGRVRQLQGGNWVLTTAGPVPVVRLRQSFAQQLAKNGGTTAIQWNEELDDNFNCFTVAGSAPYNSLITIRETGLYHVEAAIEWASAVVPENGIAKITVTSGGTTTNSEVRNSAFMKTTGFGLGVFFASPFQQTLPLSGYLKLTAGDQIALVCSNDGNSLSGNILSFFDLSSKVKSRLDLRYVGPNP